MYRKIAIFTMVLAMAVCIVPLTGFADPGKPFFGTAIYVDNHGYGSKATTEIPAPNDHNMQSFDVLYSFGGSQPSIAETAPGDPGYNGGRWIVYSVEWNVDAYPITNLYDLYAAEMAGHVTISTDPVAYVQCPLLPTK